MREKTEMNMNQKDKDILKANPVMGESDFAKKLKEWEAKEAKKEDNEQLFNKSKRHSNVSKQNSPPKAEAS